MTAPVLTRCDRCPAAALVVVKKTGAGAHGGIGELALCGHDYGDLAALLELDGWRVVTDGRERLAQQEARR